MWLTVLVLVADRWQILEKKWACIDRCEDPCCDPARTLGPVCTVPYRAEIDYGFPPGPGGSWRRSESDHFMARAVIRPMSRQPSAISTVAIKTFASPRNAISIHLSRSRPSIILPQQHHTQTHGACVTSFPMPEFSASSRDKICRLPHAPKHDPPPQVGLGPLRVLHSAISIALLPLQWPDGKLVQWSNCPYYHSARHVARLPSPQFARWPTSSGRAVVWAPSERVPAMASTPDDPPVPIPRGSPSGVLVWRAVADAL